jgi:hypothetical protein
MEQNTEDDLLRGLQQLAAGAFPRTCPTCGRVYKDFDQFLHDTQPLARHSGLKEVEEEDCSLAVEVYRNCVCGSTLMDLAQDRRDESEEGRKRRSEFEAMLLKLTQRGMAEEVAHAELLKLMHGEVSTVIEQQLKQG